MKKTIEPRVLAFDMDGTLLNEKKRICFKTKHYLRKLSREGHYIILSSGRPSRALYKYYNQLRLKTPMLCYNGAYVFNPHDKNFKPIEFQFPKDVIKEVLQKIKPHVFNVMCETDTEIWVDKEDKFLAKFFWYGDMKIHYGDLNETLTCNPMTCIVQTPFEYRDTKEVETILEKWPQLGARFWVGSPYFELYYKKTSKGAALKKICEYYKIPTSRLIAFGDATNDIEMFEAAGTSVLMKNAKYDLKDKATMVSLRDNDHDGIYYTLKQILK